MPITGFVRHQSSLRQEGEGERPLLRGETVGFCLNDVPVTTQTRLNFDVILPLRGRRGPR
jgi:hypothetical protein